MRIGLIPMAVALVIAFSCSKEQHEIDTPPVGPETPEAQGVKEFSAALPETKTYLGAPSGDQGARTWPTYWKAGDIINVNGVSSSSITIGGADKTASYAVFTMADEISTVGGYYHSIYPASAVVADSWNSTDKTLSVTIPATQTYTAPENDVPQYDPSAYIMVGKSFTATLNFSPMMGLIQLTTTAPASGTLYIKSITVEPVGDEAMSGTFTTDYSGISGGTASSGITISAASGSTFTFGTVFTFAVPAQNYASGVRFRITAVPNADGTGAEQTMVFAKQSAFDVAAGTIYPLTAPAFKESSISLACTFKTSSSLGLEWSGANAANNIKKPWRLAIYSDSGCNTLVVQHDIPADPGGTGVWKDQGSTPRFIVGGLSQGATYYCKVTDIQSGVFKVQSFTTDAFTPVSALSPSGSTLVAEDFSEIGWGPAYLGGYSGHRYAGWSPVENASANNAISYEAPTGVVSNGYYKAHDYAVNSVLSNFNYDTAPRLQDGWGYYWEGEFNGYPQAGFLRMGGKNSSRSFVVCPALSITDGKYATVDVTVVVTHMVNGDVSNNPDFGVFKETGLTLENATQRKYTGAALNHAYPLVLSKYGYNKDELTFRVNGVKNSDHLVLGLYKNVDQYNRYFLFSVKIDRVGDEYNDEIFDITDATSLELFRSRIAAGATSLKGNVVNDVDASSIASSWTPIAGYTGTLEGNNKTISGLTQPFFDNLQGTVQNLTLNSTINEADRAQEQIAIFARTLEGGTLSYCNTAGSVTYNPSSAINNGTRYVAGFVGFAKSGSLVHCTNDASISVPDNSASNDAIIEAAGVVARLGNGTTSNVSCSYLTNNGTVSVGIDATGSNNLRTSIGGAIAYVINRKTAGPNLDHLTNNGSVEYSGKSGGQLMVGGVVGWTYIDDNGNVTKSTGSYWENTASVSVTSAARVATAKDINVGGVVGVLSCALSNSTNYGTVNNSGTFSDTAADICVGGIAGNNKGHAMSNCRNENSGLITDSGKVSNSGGGSIIAVGGLVGWSNDGSAYTSSCFNEGAVSNSATASSSSRIGGLVGCASGANTLTGNSSVYNSNNGSITDSSSSDQVSIAGICGWTNRAATNLSYCRNLAGGVVTVRDGSPRNVYASGILAIADNNDEAENTNVSVTLTCASNAGAINFTGLTIGNIIAAGGILGQACGNDTVPLISGTDADHQTTNSGSIEFTSCSIGAQMRIGGILGWWDNTATATLQYCTNTGSISTHTQSDGSTDLTTQAPGFHYIGGIVGGSAASSNKQNKTIQHCNNTNGHILIYSPGTFRIGGIVGYCSIAPSDCSCTANITYGRNSYATTGRSQIGGISGYHVNGTRTFSQLHYNGTLDTSGDYCYASGLIGYTNGNCTFNSCSVQGSVKCSEQTPGLFFSVANDAKTIKFTSCTVKGGTTVINSSVTTTISAASDFTAHNLVGGVGGTSSTLPPSGLSVN